MAYFACAGCGRHIGVRFERLAAEFDRAIDRVLDGKVGGRDVVNGTVRCYECDERTAFEIHGTDMRWYSTKDEFGQTSDSVPDVVRTMHAEALLCFFGNAYRAVPGMCRSCVEQSLIAKRVEGKNIDTLIQNAPKQIMGDEERMLANGARLIGRNSLHRLAPVTRAQALAMITATTDLINHIAAQQPLPASQ